MIGLFVALGLLPGGNTPAKAAGPHPTLVVSVEPESVFSASSSGGAGVPPEPACRSVGDGVALCLVAVVGEKGEKGEKGERVSRADLVAWGLTMTAAEATAKAAALHAWQKRPAEPQSVEGVAGRYWLRMEGDGADAAAALLPEQLLAIAGAPPVVAFPQHGVVLFWVPGDPELDKVMAVGVKRMAEAAAEPVSGRVFRWEGGRWVLWGEAKAAAGESGPPG